MKRLLVTLVGAGVYLGGMHVFLPGVDRDLIRRHLSRSPESDYALYDLFTGGALSRPSIVAFGITPYLLGAVFALLASGLVPGLARLRDGDRGARQRFDGWVFGLTAAIALVQSWGLAGFLGSVRIAAGLTAPGGGVTIGVIAAGLGGSMLLVWIAYLITSHGLANGIVVLLLTRMLHDLVPAAVEGVRIQAQPASTVDPMHPAVAVVLGVVLIAALVWVVRARRPLHLTGPRASETTGGAPELTLRVNTAGIIPLWTANVVMLPVERLGATPEGGLYWVLYVVAAVGFVYAWTALTFSSQDLVGRMGRYGYRVPGAQSEDDAVAQVDRTIERSVVPYAVVLAALAVVPTMLFRWFRMNWLLASVLGSTLLLVVAMAVALIEGAGALLAMQRADDGTGWTPVFLGETDLDAECVRARLRQDGIDAVRFSNRGTSVTGSFAFWESARPSAPSLTVYRRLGGGEAYVMVRGGQAESARKALARLSGARGDVTA